MAESYNHEVSSCGLWPGGGKEGALHSYAYPEPDGFADYPVEPDAAFYSTEYKQSVLPYEAARTDEDPDHAVARLLQTTYEAAAKLLAA
jgi:hypothetical protein